ncbi:MAG: beta-propeller fold lactonase family protein, partial [Bryobacteraceae bacterium]|nr:beta-propeller fold lactonase family protein [Bryobacteraceae bacterium]
MTVGRLTALLCLAAAIATCATFGTVVTLVGGAADIVFDESRSRLYLVNTNQTRIEVYSTQQRRFLSPIRTESLPLAAAISRNGRFLYVAAHEASSLNIIDLETLELTGRVSLPAKPEGVAVGGDGRVLISTIGTGTGNLSSVLLTFDPEAADTRSLTAVAITPPPPASPLLPSPLGRIFLSSRSQMQTSRDGNFIVGVNIPNANSRTVFVYEVASATVLRSRTILNASSVLSIAPDGSRFMAGLTLFDTQTLQILAQQNIANSPYPFANGTNFNLQQNQGGSAFAPDGSTLYSAFNIAPVQNPPARASVSQMMLNDPENLLIRLGLQLPENLTGKMVMTSDGSTIYALSDSGFMILPVSTISLSPIAVPESTVTLLTSDQCGVYSSNRSSAINVANAGRGRLTATAQLLQTTPTGPGGIGGIGGPGGGAPGGGVVIILPPAPGGIIVPVPPTLPGGIPTPQNPAVAANSPTVRSQNTADGSRLDLDFTTAAAARTPGTVSPTHTFLVQSNEAINIPSSVRVFQNFRDSESRGSLIPIPVGLSANEALEDLVVDQGRRRLYIANSGLNRIEVFDMRTGQLMNPIRAGQLPRSLAMTPDGATLYVANSGGENIGIVDLDRMQVTGRVKFPPLPFNSGAATITPSIIAASE